MTEAVVPREIGLRDVFRAILVVGAFQLPVVTGVLLGPSVGFLLFLSLVPFGLYGLLHLRDPDRGFPVLPGLFVSGGFAVFFGTGSLAWASAGRELSVGYADAPSSSVVTRLVAVLAAATAAFIVGEYLAFRPRQTDRSSSSATLSGSLVSVAHALSFAALAGAILTISHLGGWRAAAGALAMHDKQATSVISGTLGFSLWQIFALPALIAPGIAALERNMDRRIRLLAAAECGALAYVAVVVFGSRLLLTLGALGIAAGHFTRTNRRLQIRHGAIALAALLSLSGFVLAARPGMARPASPVERQLRTLGYGIFDVSIASWQKRQELGPEFRDMGRNGRVLASVFPVVGGRGANINADRVDVMTAQVIGTSQQGRTTGLPPSIPAFLVVAFGPLVALAAGAFAGVAVGGITSVLIRHVRGVGVLFFGLWCSFVFNDFKGGDLAVDLTTELKRWLYVAVVVLLVGVLPRRTRSTSA